MYIYLKIDNICGIDEEIKIDFLAEPRKRTKKETVVELEKGKYINKLTGILGCNASGKSSIIKAISAIDWFITYFEKNKSKENDEKYFTKKIENILPKANVSRKEEYSCIELCSYIENCSKPGIYTYRLEYTLNNKSEDKMKEVLKFKKDFESEEKEILNITKKKLESEIGIKYNYKESFLEQLEEFKGETVYDAFVEKLEYYKCFYEYILEKLIYTEFGLEDSELQYYMIQKWIEQDKSTLEKVVKLIDNTIDTFELETIEGRNRKKIVYYNKEKEKLTFYDMSSGTRKFLTYIYLLLMTLNLNGTILIDEIENSLHIDLVKFILKLVTLKDSHSQIIFTTNNQYTFDEEIMRIDQMYYLEKNSNGKTDLKRFSVSLRDEYNSNQVRNDQTIRLRYKEKSICKGFQPSKEEIDEFICFMEDKNVLNKYVY